MDGAAPSDEIFAFDNSYARLPERLFARLAPEVAPKPQLLQLNDVLAEELGLDPKRLKRPDAVEVLAGARVAEGSDPIAMAYGGHQFGNWAGRLGDGRALLLGEVIDREGRRRDIQLKGSGRTPYSRGGDGKAPLGPVLREFIISEAMHALGIPTTRSLAAVATGEAVYRDIALPGAVLARVAASHIRIGTFQFFYAEDDEEALKALVDYAIARHDPAAAEAEVPALALLKGVMARQADLVARWMGVGFVHGVMNTDNMTISGETIDYGPCAFLDAYREGQVFSSIDQGGRYAYGAQPQIAHWNLAQLAQALLPLIPGTREAAVEIAQSAINAFPDLYKAAWLTVIRRKLGLTQAEEGDAALAADLLKIMEAGLADFTLTFRRLAQDADGAPGARDLFEDPAPFDAWAARWRARQEREPTSPAERQAAMLVANPLFIPRNHRVEAALEAAGEGDFAPLERLCATLRRPFAEQPEQSDLSAPPDAGERVFRTFCGT